MIYNFPFLDIVDALFGCGCVKFRAIPSKLNLLGLGHLESAVPSKKSQKNSDSVRNLTKIYQNSVWNPWNSANSTRFCTEYMGECKDLYIIELRLSLNSLIIIIDYYLS
jgi:hypothetical protein